MKHHSWYLCQISLQIMLFPILIHSWALWRLLDECTGLLLCCSRWSLACVQTSPLPQKKNREKRRLWIADDNHVPVSPECWGQPLIGCNANAMTEIISGVSIGEWNSIDSPGKNSAFVDSLLHLYLLTWISALWNRHVKLRPLMFAAPVAGGRTEMNA